jgi:hypothetical protein
LLVVGTLAGALVLFAWQTVSHEALHLPERGLRAFPNDSSGSPAHVIRALAPENGVYYSARGVFAAVGMSADYADKTTQFVPMLLKQLLLDAVVALILLALIDRLGEESTLRTAATYGVLALAYQGFVDVSNAIWWNFPLGWTLGNMLDQMIGFFLVGLTLAALRKRFGDVGNETAERPVTPPAVERYPTPVMDRGQRV